jgi:hypothetical protein
MNKAMTAVSNRKQDVTFVEFFNLNLMKNKEMS